MVIIKKNVIFPLNIPHAAPLFRCDVMFKKCGITSNESPIFIVVAIIYLVTWSNITTNTAIKMEVPIKYFLCIFVPPINRP